MRDGFMSSLFAGVPAPRWLVAGGVAFGVGIVAAGPAAAIPAFSVQTGEECAACHVGGFGPQLTQHGRIFKMEGYGATQSWINASNKQGLALAAMAVANYTHTAKAQSAAPADHFNANNNVALQEASIFLGGRAMPGVGIFAQATYSGVDRKASLDNFDIRIAHETKLAGKDAVLGISVNNNPTVQDVWNTTPAWGFPYTSPDLAPAQSGAPLVYGGLEQQVLGTSGYIWFDDKVYVELGGYRALSDNLLHTLNLSQDAVVDGTAPYWRVAYSHSAHGRTATLGAFGLDAKLRPDPTVSDTDRYSDIGIDASYQAQLPKKAVLSFNAAYVKERRTLGVSFAAGEADQRKGNLTSLTLDTSYYWDRKYGVTAGLFRTTGSADDILFAPEADAGSRTGKPDTEGFRLQADWTPFGQEGSWGAPHANLRLGVQYTGYSKFNGASSNYDGFGRDAKDNNTLSVFAWTAF